MAVRPRPPPLVGLVQRGSWIETVLQINRSEFMPVHFGVAYRNQMTTKTLLYNTAMLWPPHDLSSALTISHGPNRMKAQRQANWFYLESGKFEKILLFRHLQKVVLDEGIHLGQNSSISHRASKVTKGNGVWGIHLSQQVITANLRSGEGLLKSTTTLLLEFNISGQCGLIDIWIAAPWHNFLIAMQALWKGR